MSDRMGKGVEEPNELLGDAVLKKLFLTKEPFSAASDRLYNIESWTAHFQLLQHLILYNNVLMVMTSKKGNGKTTFANQFSKSLPEQFVAHTISATDDLTGKELQLRLIQLFSLNSVGLNTNDIVGGYLEQLKSRKQHAVLIIDNAHLLSDEILQMLFYYISRQSETAYLHFLLVGDTELIAYIENELGENHESVHFFDLPGMTVQETEGYLTERLKDAGFAKQLPFDKHTLLSIHKKSEGNFKQLLLLAKDTFLAFNKLNRLQQTFLWRRYVATGLVSSLVIVFSFLLAPGLMKNKLKTESITLPQRQFAPVHDLVKHETLDVVIEPLEETVKPSVIAHGIKKIVAQKSIKAVKHKKKKRLALKALIKHKIEKKVIPEPSMDTQLKAIAADRKSRERTRHVVLDSVIVLPSPLDGVASWAESIPITETNHYVIQLLASTKVKAIQHFVKTHSLPDDLKLYKTHHKDRDWYTLVLGNFLSRSEAKKAIKTLPKTILSMSPWVRSTKKLALAHDLNIK
jgi:type II secretory pathway predicted ATPase ExeA